jgi:hypothetical protein
MTVLTAKEREEFIEATPRKHTMLSKDKKAVGKLVIVAGIITEKGNLGSLTGIYIFLKMNMPKAIE